jgi:hypothetical protein
MSVTFNAGDRVAYVDSSGSGQGVGRVGTVTGPRPSDDSRWIVQWDAPHTQKKNGNYDACSLRLLDRETDYVDDFD